MDKVNPLLIELLLAMPEVEGWTAMHLGKPAKNQALAYQLLVDKMAGRFIFNSNSANVRGW